MIFPLRQKCANIVDLGGSLLARLYERLLPEISGVVSFDKTIKLKEEPPEYAHYLRRYKGLDYLGWLYTIDDTKNIVGCANKNNELSSYVILTKSSMRGRRVLRIIDYFIGDSNGNEILAIIRHIIKNQKIFDDSGSCRFLVLSIFPKNNINVKVPFFGYCRAGKARLYYNLPDELKGVEMLHYLADGDFGFV